MRSGECLDVHYFAVLIGVGATTVNAYLAQEASPTAIARGLFGKLPLGSASRRYQKSVERGPAEDHVEDGHRGDLVLSRRL